jgi:RES domain-containing protein
MVYAAEHLSLSILEILVHARSAEQRQAPRSKATIDIPDQLIAAVDTRTLKNFSFRTPNEMTQTLGDAWLRSLRSPALRVPSAVISTESCILLNPLHPDYEKCVWSGFTSVELDPRLWAV